MTFPAPQEKPVRRLNYQEKVKAGLVERKPRARLRKVAVAKVAEDRKYKQWIREALFGARCCFPACGRITWIEPHHPFARDGENLFKVIPLCHEHHSWVHANSNEAYALGWLQPEYKRIQRQPNHPQPFTLLPYP